MILLALGAAVAYGASDFIGGLLSRRWPAARVALVGQLAASTISLTASLVVGGAIGGSSLLWAMAAGIGSVLGVLALYRGLALGKMNVAGPLSAVGAAGLPVLVDVLLGERLAFTAWLAIAVAFPAIWLVSTSDPETRGDSRVSGGVLEGLLAGVGFAALFVFLDLAGDGSGLWPVFVSQLTSVLLLIPYVVWLGLRARPAQPAGLVQSAGEATVDGGGERTPIPTAEPPPERDRGWPGWVGITPGLLGVTAIIMFFTASQQGSLSVAAVITSLYPAFTVLLASWVLKERTTGLHAIGLLLCGVAIVLFTL